MSSFTSRAKAAEEIPSTSTTSSRAVLSALRALQDKIKRLETERSVALEETEGLRQQLRGLETEQDQLRARDDAMAQRNIMEARNQYDRLLAEKTDIEARVSRAEDRKKDMQRSHDDLKDEIRALLDEKQVSLSKIKDLESQISHLESQLGTLQRKESELGQTLGWEVKRHDDEMEALNRRLEELQKELLQTVKEKSALDTKMAELDHLVGQLLAINESLVAKLTGGDEKKGKKSGKKAAGSVRTGGASNPSPNNKSLTSAVTEAKAQSESIKTAAAKLKVLKEPKSERKRVKKASSPSYAEQLSSRSRANNRAGVARDVRSMKGVNNMYHDLLKELVTNREGPHSLAQRSNGLLRASAAASEAVRAASVAATDQQRQVEASILLEQELENFRDDGSRADDEVEDEGDEDGDNDDGNEDEDEEEGDEDEDKEDEPEASVPMFDMQSRFSPAALKSSSFGAFLSSADLEIGGGAEDYDDANAGAGASADAGAGAGAGAGADYHTKLAGLELEFVELDQQYHQILKGVDGAGSAVDTADAAERLVEVIRRLHEKGRELRELRSSPSK